MIPYLVRAVVLLAVVAFVVTAGPDLLGYLMLRIVWSSQFGTGMLTLGVSAPIAMWLDARDHRPRPAPAGDGDPLLPHRRDPDDARR